MKRKCPYCEQKLRAKEYEVHRREKHSKPAFSCLDGCVRCCVDRGVPPELTLRDFERIRHHLQLTAREIFEKYCEILWNNIPHTYTFIPSIGLRFPCGFLMDGLCRIYAIRPIHCRLFPEALTIDSGLEHASAFKDRGYRCIDQGFEVEPERKRQVEEIMEFNNMVLEETASLFENHNYCVNITKLEYRGIMNELENVGSLEYNSKRRELFNRLIKASFQGDINAEFAKKIEELDKRFPL